MTETTPIPLDEVIYDRFKEFGAMQAYEYLDGDKPTREAQKQSFLSGEVVNPKLDYPKIDIPLLASRENQLLKLKNDILHNEPNEIVKQVYRWKINEKIAEIRMLQAAESGDMRRFKKYSEFVYGKPSEDIFGYTINSIRSKAKFSLISDDESIQAAARELLEILPGELPHHEISLIPTDEAIASMIQATLESTGDLIQLPEGTTFDASNIKATFDSALETLKADGWQVVIDTSSKSGISVDQEKQQVKIPEGRKLTPDKLQTLIVHEIGTHVKRRVTGERSKLKLLGLGLDRYESGEEGVATAREQAMSGKVDDFAGLDGHLAIGLAYGLDGKPRDFREVYEVLKKYYKLTSLTGKEAKETVEDKSSDKAWNRCVRTFRGSDSKTMGTCFTKDIVYREGNIGTWNVVRDNPKEMARFDVGKYDPSNPRHIWILETLGIEDAEIV